MTGSTETQPRRWQTFLRDCTGALETVDPVLRSGRLTRVAGLVMEGTGLKLAVGSGCTVLLPNGNSVDAEVVGFSGEKLFLMPAHDVHGLVPGARVVAASSAHAAPMGPSGARRAGHSAKHLPVGEALLGRVLDGAGTPLDRLGPLNARRTAPLSNRPINPLERAPIRQPLDVGVRSINALLTVGRGQRMGLFAGSGIGKSVLLGMMARYTAADVIVVGLIGERGREVKEFIEEILQAEGLARAVVVATPADTSPLMRLQGAAYATAIAEQFRAEGRHVLLIMDSLTRYAMAQREIALAIGEPPVTRGYPPSVFAKLPQLVERAGNGAEESGSITAFYTVLVEGDDLQDPIADSVRAVLDGHVVLSRALADQGHYPAIDIEASVSRVLPAIAGAAQLELVRRFRALYSRYQRSRDLISVGAYASGHDAALDEAVRFHPRLGAFLQQGMRERESHDASIAKLAALFQTPELPITAA